MPRFSIIVPAYNSERYIGRCLSSIKSQTFENYEVIIIDDGSVDQTSEIVQNSFMIDGRFHLHKKSNEGVSIARNIGLSLARGEYIAFIDSDDWVDPDFLEVVNSEIQNSSTDLIIMNYTLDFSTGTRKSMIDLPVENGEIKKEEYLNRLFCGDSYPSVCNKIFKRSTLQNVRFPQNISLGEDLLVAITAALNADSIRKLNSSKLHYFQNIDSITKDKLALKIYQLETVFDSIQELLRQRGLTQFLGKRFIEYRFLHIINFLLSPPYPRKLEYQKGLLLTIEYLNQLDEPPAKLPPMQKKITSLLIRYPKKSIIMVAIYMIYIAKTLRRNK